MKNLSVTMANLENIAVKETQHMKWYNPKNYVGAIAGGAYGGLGGYVAKECLDHFAIFGDTFNPNSLRDTLTLYGEKIYSPVTNIFNHTSPSLYANLIKAVDGYNSLFVNCFGNDGLIISGLVFGGALGFCIEKLVRKTTSKIKSLSNL